MLCTLEYIFFNFLEIKACKTVERRIEKPSTSDPSIVLHTEKPPKMCNEECCALKSALHIRRMKRLIEQRRKEEANAKPIPIIATPPAALHSFEDIQNMADFIIKRSERKPKFGLICSHSFDILLKYIENPVAIQFSEIPHFPSHFEKQRKGTIYVGNIKGISVIAMKGRFHYYEGFQIGSCSMPVRMMKLCGVEYLFLTGASSAINKKYNLGTICLIKDHINIVGMFGLSPLIGPNEKRFGERFFGLDNAYDEELIQKALVIAEEIGQEDLMNVSIYGCMGGPFLETLAENNFLRAIGVDIVGNSFVPEVIYARHCGMKVFSCTLITVKTVDAQGPDKAPADQIQQGQLICMELISRIIYKIEHNL